MWSYLSAPSAKLKSPCPAANSFLARSKVKTTASALIGSPLWKTRFGRILISQFSGSSIFIDSATAATMFPSLSSRKRVSWIDKITSASDCVNIGSRLTGSALLRNMTGLLAAMAGPLAGPPKTSPKASIEARIACISFMVFSSPGDFQFPNFCSYSVQITRYLDDVLKARIKIVP